MDFDATLETLQTETITIAKITLSGQLDSNSASAFKEKVEVALEKQPKKLVLIMQDLKFMASAGLRVLTFLRQKQSQKVGQTNETIFDI